MFSTHSLSLFYLNTFQNRLDTEFNFAPSYLIWHVGSVPKFKYHFLPFNHAGCSKKKTKTLAGFAVGFRAEILLRLLLPSLLFFSVTKTFNSILQNNRTCIYVPAPCLDLLALVLFTNPLFLNTVFFDLSCFINSFKSYSYKILYYVFKLPLAASWLILFVPYSCLQTSVDFKGSTRLVSLEKLFKALGWAEREVSELFGIRFLNKVSDRKLITDYFFKSYPMLKWVPSVGFSEVSLSAEGYFVNRSIKLFNSALS